MQGLQNAAGDNRTACAAVGGAIKDAFYVLSKL